MVYITQCTCMPGCTYIYLYSNIFTGICIGLKPSLVILYLPLQNIPPYNRDLDLTCFYKDSFFRKYWQSPHPVQNGS